MNYNEKIHKVYVQYYKILKIFFSKRVPYYDVDDFVHLTFLKIIPKINNIKENILSYLLSVAKNLIIDHFRKNQKVVYYYNLEEIQLSNQDKYLEIELILNKLSHEEREIIKMKIFDGFSFKEISQLKKLNINTVISKFNRAIKKVSKYLL